MTPMISEELLGRVSAYVAERMGLHFPKERWNDLERGLRQAAPELGFKDGESCARSLLLSPMTKPQIEILASYLTVGETYFFRDKKNFDILENRILPALIQKKRDSGRQLRIWSAGCATGEEAYSVAILLRRLIHDIKTWNITILATDINPLFLGKAANGVYGEWSFRDVPAWVKERYFQSRGQGKFAILPDIKKSVTFAYHNLAEDPYPSLLNNTNAMDIILCRNVLMYFSRDHQQNVVRRLCNSLVEGGLLFGSPTEISAADCAPFLQQHFPEATLYQKDSYAKASLDYPAPMKLPVPVPELRPPVSFAPPAFPGSEKPPVEAALSALTKATEPEKKTAQQSDPYQDALTFYQRSQYQEAEEKISILLSGGHETAPALALLARIRANLGRLAEARDLCAKAIGADKLNPGYHYLLATILQELAITEESMSSFKRAIYLDPNFVLAHFALGTFALQQGKTKESDKHLENARRALRNFGHDDILPESEGVTAGRMEEIIMSTLREEALI
jgi:chemotaxis protein methyltransferase CheR